MCLHRLVVLLNRGNLYAYFGAFSVFLCVNFGHDFVEHFETSTSRLVGESTTKKKRHYLASVTIAILVCKLN